MCGRIFAEVLHFYSAVKMQIFENANLRIRNSYSCVDLGVYPQLSTGFRIIHRIIPYLCIRIMRRFNFYGYLFIKYTRSQILQIFHMRVL